MKEIIKIENLGGGELNVVWHITKMCNLHCSYCIQQNTRQEINTKKIKDEEEELCRTAIKLNHLIEKSSFKKVAIRMVGGEVSLFNVEKILKCIMSKRLIRVAFTTNFTQSSEYYSHLANYLKSRDVICWITASYHYESARFTEYFKKIEKLKDIVKITCEMVNTEVNNFYVKAFVNRCKQLKIDYTVDMDKREKTNRATMSANENFEESSRKVYFSDGSVQNIRFINKLFTDKDVVNIENKRYLKCNNFICSNSYDYLVVKFNKIQGRTLENLDCKQFIKFEDFKWLPPSKCVNENCSLCGQMSVWRE